MSVQSLSMAMGQNAPAPPGVLVVRLGHPAHITVDLCALLIGEDGKVADESDFVFYNQPNHPSGAVTISPAPQATAMRVDTAAIPTRVVGIVVAATVDGGGRCAGLTVSIDGASGGRLEFSPDRLDEVNTAVLVQVYRRLDTWKVRAVGQGWASGLAGLAADYGIAVDDDSAPTEREATTGDRPQPDHRRQPAAAAPEPSTAHPIPAGPGSAIVGAEVQRLMEQRATLSAELFALTKQVRDARAALVQTDELALLQEVGFYQYSHPLDDAVAYRDRLDALRAKIKGALKHGSAVNSRPGWTVNGSTKEGAALVRDFSTLMLRAYNVEADNCVRTVRPHSLSAGTKRLDRTRDAILKLGALMGIAIDDGYHEMRVRELRLMTDFQAKLEDEKENVRAAREQQREDAKALAELQREAARLLKERSHYESVLARLEKAKDVEGQARVLEQIAAIDEGLRGVQAREANTRAGYVYVISNPGAFGELMVKIGMTRRLDPMDRVRELGNASVPFRFDVHALIFSADAVGLEGALHTEFAASRVNRVNLRREFFFVTPVAVRDALLKVGRDHVLEFKEVAEALEWRQSRAADAPQPTSAQEPDRPAGIRLRRDVL